VNGKCRGCNICEMVCYMNVPIMSRLGKGQVRDINCIYCGQCVEACSIKLLKMTLR
jgi:formate hydrogenlyase subunit 6/NADH:ubiquinone oxidoreductase subunit I